MDFTESRRWWERGRDSRIEWTYEGREKGQDAGEESEKRKMRKG